MSPRKLRPSRVSKRWIGGTPNAGDVDEDEIGFGEAQIAESDVEPGREDIDVDFKDRFAERQIGQGGGTVHAEARGGFLSRIELLKSVQSDDSYDAGVKVTQHGSSECIDETTYRIIQPIDKRLNHVERIELVEDCVEDVPPAAVGEAEREVVRIPSVTGQQRVDVGAGEGNFLRAGHGSLLKGS